MRTDLDAALFRDMFLGGAKNLSRNKELVNDLNVFPVPDGDTGTNMTLTIMSAANAVSNIERLDMESFADAMSNGSLRGARGNSGVILSQILRGISKVIKKQDSVDTTILACAFKKACETAYSAVMQPKEGTILTIIKEISEAAMESVKNTTDIEEFFEIIHTRAKETLDRTPDMLPVLREAGVVDSGGMGLLIILEGWIAVLQGKEIEGELDYKPREKPARHQQCSDVEIKFGYCTEFIILLSEKVAKPRLQELEEYLKSRGDSIVFVPDDELIKVHIHTNEPGKVISRALTFGELSSIKIDNMREEHRELVIKNAPGSEHKQELPHKDIGFVTVVAGSGFVELFKEIGADEIIEGGQTMNPSTDDILEAVKKVNADTVFILPNNKNIILAAEQAVKLCENKRLIVIPTTTVPQGITALLSYVGGDADEVREIMTESASTVKTGSVTYAVRDTQINSQDIHVGDIMAIGDNGLMSVGSNREAVLLKMLEQFGKSSELLTIYYGDEVKEEEAVLVKKNAEKLLPDKEIDIVYGGQPVYYYLVSAE